MVKTHTLVLIAVLCLAGMAMAQVRPPGGGWRPPTPVPPAQPKPTPPAPAPTVTPAPTVDAAIQTIRQAATGDAAMQAWQKATAAYPNNARVNEAFLRRLIQLGLADNSMVAVEALLKVDAGNGYALGTQAYLQIKQGNSRHAPTIKLVMKAAQALPTNVGILHNLAQLMVLYERNPANYGLTDVEKDSLAKLKVDVGKQDAFRKAYKSAEDISAANGLAPAGKDPPSQMNFRSAFYALSWSPPSVDGAAALQLSQAMSGWTPPTMAAQPAAAAPAAGMPTPGTPKPVAPAVNTDTSEGRAAELLKTGLMYFNNGMKAKAREIFNDIITVYGNTKSAAEAKIWFDRCPDPDEK